MTDSEAVAALRQLIHLIADDSHALTFQTFGQYRSALIAIGRQMQLRIQAKTGAEVAAQENRP